MSHTILYKVATTCSDICIGEKLIPNQNIWLNINASLIPHDIYKEPEPISLGFTGRIILTKNGLSKRHFIINAATNRNRFKNRKIIYIYIYICVCVCVCLTVYMWFCVCGFLFLLIFIYVKQCVCGYRTIFNDFFSVNDSFLGGFKKIFLLHPFT